VVPLNEDNIREVNMAMEDRETFSLIGSDKVEGTNVYGVGGEKIGYIERVMIDKVSGIGATPATARSVNAYYGVPVA
jgi:hypothetical protein